jgi:hypothetical protein
MKKCIVFDTLAHLVTNSTLKEFMICIRKHRGQITVAADRLREKYIAESRYEPALLNFYHDEGNLHVKMEGIYYIYHKNIADLCVNYINWKGFNIWLKIMSEQSIDVLRSTSKPWIFAIILHLFSFYTNHFHFTKSFTAAFLNLWLDQL